jgi:AbrB family looped-hinge helix DNA binding protein
MKKVKVSLKGQIVIPKVIREKVGIKEGDEVIIESSEESVIILKKPKDPVKEMRGLFRRKFKKSSVELVKELRKEWDKHIGS